MDYCIRAALPVGNHSYPGCVVIVLKSISAFFQDVGSLMATISFGDVIDIIIVALLIYKIIELIRKTSSYYLAKGLLFVLIALWISGLFKLTMINYFLRKAIEIGLIALVIIFQPELRKLLTKMGSSSFYALFSQSAQNSSELDNAINQTVLACEQMSATKTGALIIFERRIKLGDIMTTGTVIDSDINAELIKNIFYPKAPLHDGAMVIRSTRIAAAGCMLPLSGNINLSKDLGMRHRAGIGASEQTDAVVVIVSEETGAISVAIEGMLKRNLDKKTFEMLLRNELMTEDTKNGKATGLFARLFGKQKVNGDEEQ